MTTNPPPESVPRRKRLESLIDRFLNFLFIASASVIVLLAAWLIITMPGGSGDPRAPVAGPVPTLA